MEPLITVDLASVKLLPDDKRIALRAYIRGGEVKDGAATVRYRDIPEVRRLLGMPTTEAQASLNPFQFQPGLIQRDERQLTVAAWCVAAFGLDHASSLQQRGVRLLEEAIEAYQSAGGDAEMAHKLIDYVFARPPGDLRQELGGVGVTALALANAAGISADEAEFAEVQRVLAKPLAHFAKRNQAKNEAGFNVCPPANDSEEKQCTATTKQQS